ncbi:MAG TPA: hypothetical protein VI911_11930 [Patescibacteria group bacterium]|nr:hypothetical protein [Patescibacteria group bacterium]
MNKKDQAIVDKAISMDWDDLAHSIIKLEIESDKIQSGEIEGNLKLILKTIYIYESVKYHRILETSGQWKVPEFEFPYGDDFDL